MEIIVFLSCIDWKTITSIVVAIGLLLFVAFKLFAKSFIQSLGDESAKLLMTKQKTLIEEAIKSGYASLLAEQESALQKKNIAFEVEYSLFNTERSKRCIELYKKLEAFYDNAFRFTFGYHTNIFFGFDSNYETRKSDYKKSHKDLVPCFNEAKIFLQEDLEVQIRTFIGFIADSCEDFEFYDDEEPTLKDEDIEKLHSITQNVILKHRDFEEIRKSLKLLIHPNDSQ